MVLHNRAVNNLRLSRWRRTCKPTVYARIEGLCILLQILICKLRILDQKKARQLCSSRLRIKTIPYLDLDQLLAVPTTNILVLGRKIILLVRQISLICLQLATDARLLIALNTSVFCYENRIGPGTLFTLADMAFCCCLDFSYSSSNLRLALSAPGISSSLNSAWSVSSVALFLRYWIFSLRFRLTSSACDLSSVNVSISP
jgi:hypothetical protein